MFMSQHTIFMHMQNLQSHPDGALLSLREAATELRDVHPETLRRWAKAGKVPVVQYPSGRMYFRREDIEALLTPRVMSPEEVGDEADRHHAVMAGQEVLTW